jgi:uncharacterized protein
MAQPDFAGARQYALDRLARELSPALTYHTIGHTRHDVVPAVERLAKGEGIRGEELALLVTAAYLHDIGYVERYQDNEAIAVRIARSTLPCFGFSPAQTELVAGIIMATQLPQTPTGILQQTMADADLDVLGREDYFDRNDALRDELRAVTGYAPSIREWLAGQLAFLQSHRYFTATARALRDEGKQAHIACLLAQLNDRTPD